MIMCMDMDAFFVSVEQAANPLLRGKPVAVIGAKERTVVTASSYEARKLGVKTGMSKYEAKRVCPQLILVVGNNKKYTYVSRHIMLFLKGITPDVEVYSIDEAFMDVTGVKLSVVDIAYMIKSHVKMNFGITCSVGVGDNKLIAKMASGVNKPDGFYHVLSKDKLIFIDSFKLGDLWGIGKRLAKRFANIGIFTPSDLRMFGRENLEQMLGKYGTHVFFMICGDHYGQIKSVEEPVKSIGHSMTFPENTVDKDRCFNYLLQLSEMVSARARQHRVSGKVMTLTVRYADLTTFTRQLTVGYFTSATHHIYPAVRHLFDKHAAVDNGIRLLGVSISGLIHDAVNFKTIEDGNTDWESIYAAIDDINNKYGFASASFGSVLNCRRKGAVTISPAWRPDGVRSVDVV